MTGYIKTFKDKNTKTTTTMSLRVKDKQLIKIIIKYGKKFKI